MEATELEMAVVHWLLDDPEQKLVRRRIDFRLVKVLDRELTGAGFLTEFEKSAETKLFDDGASLRWGKVGARLNESKVETGYLVYVEDGYLTTVEGYTYGDEWPDRVSAMELYELKPGMEIRTS